MRKKKHPEHANHERWLVSYADFITLLFAFFVVMFANSQADKGKAAQVSESVKAALSEGSNVSAVVAALMGGTVKDTGKGNAQLKGAGGEERVVIEKKDQKEQKPVKEEKVAKEQQPVELLPSMTTLTETLKKEIESGKVQITMASRGLIISFKQAATFSSGTDEISASIYPSMAKVAAVLNKIPNPVRFEGHTDSVPIHTVRFRSNWELSAARSIAMMELLAQHFKVPRNRLSIGGYADTAPNASNETDEGRALNRRVDIIIFSQSGMAGEPKGSGAEVPAAKPSAAKH